MPNYYYVPSAADSRGAVFEPTRETGLSFSQRAQYSGSQPIGGNADLDFALLLCSSRPGDSFGVVTLQPAAPSRGDAVYVVQQNCDYYSEPGCHPTKLLFRGNAGGGNEGSRRGTIGRAVPMSGIVPSILANFASVNLAGRAPAPGLSADAFEPNDREGGPVRGEYSGPSGSHQQWGDRPRAHRAELRAGALLRQSGGLRQCYRGLRTGASLRLAPGCDTRG